MMLPDLRAATIRDALQGDLPPDIRRVLELRAHAAKASTKKFKRILEVEHDGRLHDMLVYHGAGPGRYSSQGGLNLQNLPRGAIKDTEVALQAVQDSGDELLELLYGEPLDCFSGLVRACLVPSPGKQFVDADFSSIENRIAAWVVEDEATVEKFRAGFDQYVDFASIMYHTTPEQVAKTQRQVAKSAVLGCLASSTQVKVKDLSLDQQWRWEKIGNVKCWEYIWDGAEFVRSNGPRFTGRKRCIRVDGVWMTPDHKLFVDGEWIEARHHSLADFSCIRRLSVFDIVNSGPRNRFVVKSNSGTLVAHNCVYGQGWRGYIDYASTFGVVVDAGEAKRIVAAFRSAYSKVHRMWSWMGEQAMDAVRKPNQEVIVNQYLSFYFDKRFDLLKLRLPSGRMISFYKPQIERRSMRRKADDESAPWEPCAGEQGEEWSVWTTDTVTAMTVDTATRHFGRFPIPGYKFFQNAVQGIAYDFLANGMRNVENAGYDVVLTVHDEVLAEHGQPDLREFIGAMTRLPDWAEGFPLAADGWVGDRFKK